jgi:chromosome segregation ATPase
MANPTQDRLRDGIEELRTLKDEIRVELHLAKMDLRDEWKRLERRLPDAASLASEMKSLTVEMIDSMAEELRRFRERLRESDGGRPRA